MKTLNNNVKNKKFSIKKYEDETYILEKTVPLDSSLILIIEALYEFEEEKIRNIANEFEIDHNYLKKCYLQGSPTNYKIIKAIEKIKYENDYYATHKHLVDLGFSEEQIMDYYSLSNQELQNIYYTKKELEEKRLQE